MDILNYDLDMQYENENQTSVQLNNDSSRTNVGSSCDHNRIINEFSQPARTEFQRSKSIIEVEKIFGNLPEFFDLFQLEKPKGVEDIKQELKESLKIIPVPVKLFEVNQNASDKKKAVGRPKNSKTNKDSNMVNLGGSLVMKNSPDHEKHLARIRENVRKCRQRKTKRLDGEATCEYCGSCFSFKGLHCHKKKCPSRNLMETCDICNEKFKSINSV